MREKTAGHSRVSTCLRHSAAVERTRPGKTLEDKGFVMKVADREEPYSIAESRPARSNAGTVKEALKLERDAVGEGVCGDRGLQPQEMDNCRYV